MYGYFYTPYRSFVCNYFVYEGKIGNKLLLLFTSVHCSKSIAIFSLSSSPTFLVNLLLFFCTLKFPLFYNVLIGRGSACKNRKAEGTASYLRP